MTIYNLSNDRIPEHLTRIITAIQEVLKDKAYDFMLIGAAAKDIIMSGVHDQRMGRMTRDVDFALYIPEWDSYTTILDELVRSELFVRTAVIHRLRDHQGYDIDIVPFGEIQDEKGHYLWSPENVKSMTVVGFREVSEAGIIINLTESSIQFKVASIPGICVMKLLAWKDRKFTDNKDGKDLGFIIANYTDLKWNTMYEEHADLLEA